MAAVDLTQEYIFAFGFVLVVYLWDYGGGNWFSFGLLSVCLLEAKVVQLKLFKFLGLFQLFEALEFVELSIKGNGCGLLEEGGKGNFLEKLNAILDGRAYFFEEHLVTLSVLLLIVIGVLNFVKECKILSQRLFQLRNEGNKQVSTLFIHFGPIFIVLFNQISD